MYFFYISCILPITRDSCFFQKDLKTQKTVERNIEIIYEAMDSLLKANPDIQISDSQKIVIPVTELFKAMLAFPGILYGLK